MIQSGFQSGFQRLGQLADRDPRDYQLLFLGSFLLLGIGTRDWTLRPGAIAAAILSALLVQAFCEDWLRPQPLDQLHRSIGAVP
jgi:hypothetical protein